MYLFLFNSRPGKMTCHIQMYLHTIQVKPHDTHSPPISYPALVGFICIHIEMSSPFHSVLLRAHVLYIVVIFSLFWFEARPDTS